MNDPPFALFLTWTCYGNWLPGDERGCVSNTLSVKGGFSRRNNIPGTPFDSDDPETRWLARGLQKYPSVRLSPADAIVAATAFIAAAAARQWRIRCGAVMANHVHLPF